MDQNIFSFQGADRRNFGLLENYFLKKNMAVNVVNLAVNYRSSASIVAVSNALINSGRPAAPPSNYAKTLDGAPPPQQARAAAAHAATAAASAPSALAAACGAKNMVSSMAAAAYHPVRVMEVRPI